MSMSMNSHSVAPVIDSCPSQNLGYTQENTNTVAIAPINQADQPDAKMVGIESMQQGNPETQLNPQPVILQCQPTEFGS